MRIRPVKRRKRGGKTMFVFEFDDEQDLDWLSLVEEMPVPHNDQVVYHIGEYTGKLRGRLDDKYARDGVAFSSILFADEMAGFCEELMRALIGTGGRYLQVMSGLGDILEEHEEEWDRLIQEADELLERPGYADAKP